MGERLNGTIGRLIGSLPAPYLVLLCVNVLLVGGFLYFEDRVSSSRAMLIMHILQNCVDHQGSH